MLTMNITAILRVALTRTLIWDGREGEVVPYDPEGVPERSPVRSGAAPLTVAIEYSDLVSAKSSLSSPARATMSKGGAARTSRSIRGGADEPAAGWLSLPPWDPALGKGPA